MEASQCSPPIPKYLLPIDESKLIPQCSDLLPSLPMEPCWLSGSVHQYQGYWFNTLNLESVLCCQNHFEARDSDIFLITLPKSGTTWLKAILFALVNRTRYLPTSADHPLLSKNPHDIVPFLKMSTLPHPETTIPDNSSSTPHRIFAAHTPYVLLPESVKELSCKVVYLCRNPKDVLISSWMHINKMRGNWRAPLTLDEAFKKFCRGSILGGPYWENVLGHWKESLANPHTVMFLKYEDVKQGPGVVVRGVATFLGFPFSPDEESKGIVDEIIKLCSFEKLASLEANGPNKKTYAFGSDESIFFRKGEVGDWANYLTPEMAAQIDSITQEKFKGSGLIF